MNAVTALALAASGTVVSGVLAFSGAAVSGVLAVSGAILGIDLLEHYNYSNLDATCPCVACTEWREKQAAFYVARDASAGHDGYCRCKLCQERKKRRISYGAASDRRDLLCELSWHASRQREEVARPLMSWVWNEFIAKRTKTDHWWECRGGERTLAGWLIEYNVTQDVVRDSKYAFGTAVRL